MNKEVKVRATNKSKLLKIKIKELNRIAEEGEEFTTTAERAEILVGKNSFRTQFVTVVPEETVEEPVCECKEECACKEEECKCEEVVETPAKEEAVEEVKVEKPKRTRKKKVKTEE